MTAYDDPRRPLPRWVILPGDPAPLARWLAAQAAARGEGLPEGWPTEEPQ